MKCWPEELRLDGAAVEPFDYPSVGAPAAYSLEAFGDVSRDEGAGEPQRQPLPRIAEANAAAARATHAEELRRSFESGRERGQEEGRAAERKAGDSLTRERESRRIEAAARLAEDFRVQRMRYFETVEREVVKLALAIAARILRREAQTDPLLLSCAVRAVLG